MAWLAVHTMPNEGGGWKNVTEGHDENIITFDTKAFDTKAEAQSAARVRARRLRCEHIVYDLNGAVVARSSFGNHVYPRNGGDATPTRARSVTRAAATKRG